MENHPSLGKSYHLLCHHFIKVVFSKISKVKLNRLLFNFAKDKFDVDFYHNSTNGRKCLIAG